MVHVTCGVGTGNGWCRVLAWIWVSDTAYGPTHTWTCPTQLSPQCLQSLLSHQWWTSLSLSRKMATWWASWSSIPRRYVAGNQGCPLDCCVSKPCTCPHRVSRTCVLLMESSFATGMAPFTTCSTWPWLAPSVKGVQERWGGTWTLGSRSSLQ